ncbi:protein LAZ1 homolog 2 isoform X1 [Cucumis melo]|uniref:Protein LAZ1 homolog 2 isoform X1 n=2 Tax=Cucumis melo TaxID=3656 RepID=A0A1S4E1K4_CUCME|nr:protein LAZ1 homolog 2 isoform X1 [Cucumis melo]XP_016902105.1 protein LAZ1 homolog 2 isoform X1 [Cucumis melo]XP_016902106.1 protein LAZ1 homolog 2 isoform X1 [Cucumis melo]
MKTGRITMKTSISITLQQEDIYGDLYQPALTIATCFAVIALVLSLFLILQHLKSYSNPSEQKWIVAVLFMVPVYATQSIISLWNSRFSLACDILRNCYEAFALYSFGRYLIASLGGERRVIELLESESIKQLDEPLIEGEEKRSRSQRTLWNFLLKPHAVGKDLLTIEKFGLVQYMILKTTTAFLAFILELFGVYGDGKFKWSYGYPYIAVVLNFSQMWALYCLVQFYNATHEQLKPIKPLAKFISFKAIVFATWWQGVGIALLRELEVLPNEGKLEIGLQDFLICVEMAIAAVAHIFVLSAEPYRYIPVSACGVAAIETVKGTAEVKEGKDKKSALVEKMETHVEAPGTSVTESVQNIVLEGGQRVVKDVVLTINQAIRPVGKGMAMIQETLHQRRVSSEELEAGVEIEEYMEENENLVGTKVA